MEHTTTDLFRPTRRSLGRLLHWGYGEVRDVVADSGRRTLMSVIVLLTALLSFAWASAWLWIALTPVWGESVSAAFVTGLLFLITGLVALRAQPPAHTINSAASRKFNDSLVDVKEHAKSDLDLVFSELKHDAVEALHPAHVARRAILSKPLPFVLGAVAIGLFLGAKPGPSSAINNAPSKEKL